VTIVVVNATPRFSQDKKKVFSLAGCRTWNDNNPFRECARLQASVKYIFLMSQKKYSGHP